MFKLPELPSLTQTLPHERERRRHSEFGQRTGSGGGGRHTTPPGGDALQQLAATMPAPQRPQSEPSDAAAARRRQTKARYTRLKAKEASQLMFLVPHNREEHKQYKSILVFCDVKLKEAAMTRKGTAVDVGPHETATAACCHVLDKLAGPLWPPFKKILRKLRDEMLISVYSDHVEPTGAPPYLQRVPYHALATQLRLELGDLEKQIIELENALMKAKEDRSDFEDMVLAARIAKLDTEKELATFRQRLAQQEEEIIRLKEEMNLAVAERENAEDRTVRLSEQLEALEAEAASHSGLKDQLQESTENIEVLQKELVRRGRTIDDNEEETEKLKVTVRDHDIREAMLQKQVNSLKDEVSDLKRELSLRPAPGDAAGARPLTPRPEWEALSVVAPQVGDLSGRSDENIELLTGYMKQLQGDTITCQGEGEEVPAYLRYTGSVQLTPSSLPELRTRLSDMWRHRAVARQQGKASDSFPEFVAAYFAARWTDPNAAAQAGYNLHMDLDRHAEPATAHGIADALAVITRNVLSGDWHEGVFEDMNMMIKCLGRVLTQLPTAKGEHLAVARRDVGSVLSDYFPKADDGKDLGVLRKALSADSPSAAIDLAKVLDGGPGNSSTFVQELCQLYLRNVEQTLSGLHAALGQGMCSLAQAKDAVDKCGAGGGLGVGAVEMVARATGRRAADVTGAANTKDDVDVTDFLAKVPGTGAVRLAELYDPACKLTVGGASSAGNKPSLA